MSEWIDAKDEKPKDDEDVLIFKLSGYIAIGSYWSVTNYWCDDQGYNCDVTHWMPLPKEPEVK